MKSAFPATALAMVTILLIGPLTGCSLFPKPQSQRTFLLSPLPAQAAAESVETILPVTLRIGKPDASAPLNGSNILVMPAPREYNVYAGARWRDQVPTLLYDRLTQTFRQRGRWAAVVDEQSRVRSDVLLTSHLTAFESRYTQGSPVVVIGLNVQLIDEARREVLAERYFEIRQPSDDKRVEAVVEAFGQATDELIDQLISWTLMEMGQT